MDKAFISRIFESMTLSIIPAIFTCIFASVNEKNLKFIITSIILEYFVCCTLICIFEKILQRMNFFRPYKGYEGDWIEVIPDFSRPISICKLSYNKDEYHFDGHNYQHNCKDKIDFNSKKFIYNDDKEFYYVLKNNEIDNPEGSGKVYTPEGYGKVYNIEKNVNGYYEAEGYFLDIGNGKESKIHKTHMIKFDKNFIISKDIRIPFEKKLKQLTAQEIFEYSKTYIIKTYNLEGKYDDDSGKK